MKAQVRSSFTAVIRAGIRYAKGKAKRGPSSVFGDPLTEAPRRLNRSRLMTTIVPRATDTQDRERPGGHI